MAMIKFRTVGLAVAEMVREAGKSLLLRAVQAGNRAAGRTAAPQPSLAERLKAAPRWLAVALALALTPGLGVLAASQATAAIVRLFDPPTTSVPGPYYDQGAFVGICAAVAPGTSSYVEVHTNFGTLASRNPGALGNCAAGHVQLVVPADPSLFPVPSASASSSP
jgi:hypothetical protein